MPNFTNITTTRTDKKHNNLKLRASDANLARASKISKMLHKFSAFLSLLSADTIFIDRIMSFTPISCCSAIEKVERNSTLMTLSTYGNQVKELCHRVVRRKCVEL